MTEREKPDLSKIEPIGRVPDADDSVVGQMVDRVGHGDAAVSGAPPAVGLPAETLESGRDPEPRTSPETEEQLDQLRRG